MHNGTNAFTRNPRSTGVVCGLTSAALGLAYLGFSNAPLQYIIVNLCATAIGVAFFFAMNNSERHGAEFSQLVWLGLAVLLLGTTSFGLRVEGASRWLRVGSLTLQPSLILVPVTLVAYFQRRSLIAAVGIVVVALALALQPDRAMAGVLASATIFIAIMVRDRRTSAVALSALASFGATMYRADTLPAVPHVDRILFTAFDVNMVAGCAVILGACLLFLPAFLVRGSSRREIDAYAVFGVIWLAIVAAAAIGNYPTPVVGYGGSAILGYFLSIAFLPEPLASVAAADAATFYHRDEHDDESQLLETLRGGLVAV